MVNSNSNKRLKIHFILSLLLFLVVDVIFIMYHDYLQYGINTNTISFINIAQKYIRGEFADAVNGAFAPLISWLLILPLKLGLNPLTSVHVLNIAIGLLLLVGVRLLSYRFEMIESIRDIISYTAVPIVLNYTLRDHLADLFVVCVLVYYLYFIFSKDYPDKIYYGTLCGILGVAGYLSKAFVLPFFLSHFVLINLLHYLKSKEKRKNILINAISGIVLFSFLCVPWIMLISNKYNAVTIGTSGEYNRRVIGPEVPDPPGASWYGFEGWRSYIRMGHPVYDQGFFPPANKTALSAWEDFTYLTPYLKSWSPFESWDYLKHQIKLLLRNVYFTIGIFEGSYSVFSSVILIGYILLYLLPFNSDVLGNKEIFPLVTIILYSLGYILVHVDERYSWVINMLLLLMGGHLLHIFLQSPFFNNTRKNILVLFFIITFTVVPLNSIRYYNGDRDYAPLVNKLKKHRNLTGNIASNEHFSETLKILFYADMHMSYYGQASGDMSETDILNELQKYDIDYFLVWIESGMKEFPEFLRYYKEITGGDTPDRDSSIRDIRIYSLKDKK